MGRAKAYERRGSSCYCPQLLLAPLLPQVSSELWAARERPCAYSWFSSLISYRLIYDLVGEDKIASSACYSTLECNLQELSYLSLHYAREEINSLLQRAKGETDFKVNWSPMAPALGLGRAGHHPCSTHRVLSPALHTSDDCPKVEGRRHRDLCQMVTYTHLND